MGRCKIVMKKVENKSSRQVTFSKRRKGVFKKGNELAILCGVLVAIIVFSPGGKPYAFGNPDVYSIIDRIMNEDEDEEDEEEKVDQDPGASMYNNAVRKLNKDLKKLQIKYDEETRKEKMLDKKLAKFKSMEHMSFEELVGMKKALEKFNLDVNEEIKSVEKDLEASESLLMLAKGPVIHFRANRNRVDDDNYK
ncbi:hypothetical protein ACFE04_013929 [Oxalis oulophora]